MRNGAGDTVSLKEAAADSGATRPDAITPDTRKVVRITGERNGLVEFEYGVGDLSLALELMLPPAAFEDFCRTNAVQILTAAPDELLDEAARAMAWRPSDVQRRV